jgi:hypothetical protein
MATATPDLDAIAQRVRARLDHKSDDSPLDVYVWADGSVTGPPRGDERSDERAVAVFSPTDRALDAAAIRQSIANGLATVDRSAVDVVAEPVPDRVA